MGTTRVADRTLVAYERDDGFDCHYTHDLLDVETLSPETPFGGEPTRNLTGIYEHLRELGVTVDDDLHEWLGGNFFDTAVDPIPAEFGLTWPEVVTNVDYRLYDRCLRVSADWTVTVFLVLFFGFADRGGDERDPVGDGALLSVNGNGTFEFGWFEGMKSTTADFLRCGYFDEGTARSYLSGRIRALAGEQEVYVAGDRTSQEE